MKGARVSSGVRRAVLFVALAALVTTRAAAQTDQVRPDPDRIKFRFGPVIVNPTVTLGNIGSDGNVFNDYANPKSDLTMTVSPKAEVWLPFMGSWFQGVVAEDINWYRQYTSENSGSHVMSLDWRLPLPRLTADLGVSRIATRDRPGFEIDTRAQHVQKGYGAEVSFWFLANTAIDFLVRRTDTNFDENAIFQNVNLREELDSTVTAFTVGISQKLTPLTRVSIAVSKRHDRFTFNPLRDADATDVSAALHFDPAALFRGNVTVGYSAFRPFSDGVPNYTGTTLAADLSYSPFEVTRVTLKAERAVRYSFDLAQPYYVQTGVTVEVSQQLFGPVDVVGRSGTAALAYRNRVGLVLPEPDRSDRVTTYGGGLGYHLGRSVRVGFNADNIHRDSPLASRQYKRLTYGASLTYEF